MNDSSKTNINCTTTPLFFNIPPTQFSLLATLLGLLLIDGLDLDQQSSLGNFLSSMGQAVTTAAGQSVLLKSRADQKNDAVNDIIMEKLDILKKELYILEEQIKNR